MLPPRQFGRRFPAAASTTDEAAGRDPLLRRLPNRQIGVQAELRLVKVPDGDAARRLRLLGSPTIPVGGEGRRPGDCRARGLPALLSGLSNRARLRRSAGRALGSGSAPTRGNEAGRRRTEAGVTAGRESVPLAAHDERHR